MGKRLSIALNLALGAVLAWSLLGVSPVTGQTLRFHTWGAPGFNDVERSEHNNGTTSCPAFVPTDQGGEDMGDINGNAAGSFIQNINLPQGVEIRRLSLFTRDADMDPDHDDFLFLVRKRIAPGLDPAKGGYKVIAHTRSTGANNAMRRFSDSTILNPRVNNEDFYYYLELVLCPTTEPFAAQIAYEP